MSFKIVKVGRAKDNDIVLTDSSVSRYHCEFFFDEDGNVFVTDINSSNGTFVNGKRISGSVKLDRNDIVKPGLDVPLRWRNFSSYEQNIEDQGTQNIYLNEEANRSSSKTVSQTKVNSTVKTILITISIVIFLLALFFVINEYVLGNGKPEAIDPDKPNDKTDQPKKSKE
jgi:pSer/pThr/pTyr-binding forkhead associated (FHA) protein